MGTTTGITNQQSAGSQLHPWVQEIIQYTANSGTTHGMVLPTFPDRTLFVVFVAAEGSGEITPASGFVTGSEQLVTNDVKIGYYYCGGDASGSGTTQNWITANSTKFAAQMYVIRNSNIGNGTVIDHEINNTFSAPEVTTTWGSYANMWICAVMSSMDKAYILHPAGYTGFTETKTGTTTGDVQVYSCTIQDEAATTDPGTWTFDTGSGSYWSMQVAIKGDLAV